MKTNTDSEFDLIRRAEAALEELNAIPLMMVADQARFAVVEILLKIGTAARQPIFPDDVQPCSAATIALFSFVEDAFTRAEYPERLAHLHRFSRLRMVARAQSGATGIAPDEFADQEQERFERLIAEQLVGQSEFEPHATILARTLPQLDAVLIADHDHFLPIRCLQSNGTPGGIWRRYKEPFH